MKTRNVVKSTVAIGIAAVTLTGVTYASASGSAKPAQQAVAADDEEDWDWDEEGKDGDHKAFGKVLINERVHFARKNDCVIVASGPFSESFNVRNLSEGLQVHFFKGITCDNGGAIEKIAPDIEINEVEGRKLGKKAGVIGSFRLLDYSYDPDDDDKDDKDDKHDKK